MYACVEGRKGMCDGCVSACVERREGKCVCMCGEKGEDVRVHV